ncbi:PilZ domain-containing protein [Myxococcota bacterium]|nr:PilZ domain-containing protein [Myxococcota bacterium]
MRRVKRDLRHSPRVPLARFVVCLRRGDLVVSGDVSSGGVGFSLEDPPGVGEPICVSMILPETGEPVSMAATVCHIEPTADRGAFHVGARFTDIDTLVQSPLERHVEEAALVETLTRRMS